MTDLDFGENGRIYVADLAEKNVKVYDSTGKKVQVIEGPGQAIGQFAMPLNVAVSGQDRLAVREFNGRISFFSLDGTFLSSFVLPDLMCANASIQFIGDSLLAIGGFRPPRVKLHNWDQLSQDDMGNVIHLYTLKGKLRHSVFPFSERARKTKTLRVMGVRFDQSASGRFYAIQPTEYAIGVFNSSGDSLNRLEVSPAYYRPLNKPQPDPSDAVAGDYEAWHKTWDSPKRIFSVNDTLLAVSVWRGTDQAVKNSSRPLVDFIGKADGHVYKTIRANGKMLEADPQRQLLYFFSFPTHDSPATLRAYRLSTLLKGGRGKSASPVAAR